MNKPTIYNLTPARGQALLNFQGRIFPKTIELFETDVVEQVRQNEKQKKLELEKQSQLNSDFNNLLIQGDCLSACAYLKSKDIKVDLVYIDPPFASGANYAKTLYLRTGNKQEIEDNNGSISIGEEVLYGDIWQKEDYLNWLYERLLAIRDVMDDKGTIWLHLDWHIGHYAKVLMDEVFGEDNFLNEIVWEYTKFQMREMTKFAINSSRILWYAKNSESYTFVPQTYKLDEAKRLLKKGWDKELGRIQNIKDEHGKVQYINITDEKVDDVWNIPYVGATAGERTEYETQKPEELLERVIKSSSERGFIIADFFSGSGTSAKVAHDLGCKFIACDIGLNAIQTTRDRLFEAGANFDILKIRDGVKLFRNPAQTTAKIFSLIDGYKTRTELGLGDFWDGGIVDGKGEFVPVKFVPIHDKLTKELLDVLLEEIYQLQEVTETVSKTKVIYAHVDPELDQKYVNKAMKEAGKTSISVELVSIDDLLGEKADKLFMPDNAKISIIETSNGSQVEIKQFFSPYLKIKIDEYNSKKVKKGQTTLDDQLDEQAKPRKKISISETGLELIESVQFDTTITKDGVWVSNADLEDRAGVKGKIKGIYIVPAKKFKMKIRNIAGDEIIISSDDIKS